MEEIIANLILPSWVMTSELRFI